MACWLAAVLLDADAAALAVLEAALLAVADELFAGAAHATSIVMQKHSAKIPVSARFTAAPFPARVGAKRAGLRFRSFAFVSRTVNRPLFLAA